MRFVDHVCRRMHAAKCNKSPTSTQMAALLVLWRFCVLDAGQNGQFLVHPINGLGRSSIMLMPTQMWSYRLSNRRNTVQSDPFSLLGSVALFVRRLASILKALFCYNDEKEMGVRANGRLYRALTLWRSRLTFLQVRR